MYREGVQDRSTPDAHAYVYEHPLKYSHRHAGAGHQRLCGGAYLRDLGRGARLADVPELPLQTLSAVGCKRLRSCWLGLQPARPADREAQQALLSVGMYSPPVPVSTAWQEVPVALTSEPHASFM